MTIGPSFAFRRSSSGNGGDSVHLHAVLSVELAAGLLKEGDTTHFGELLDTQGGTLLRL